MKHFANVADAHALALAVMETVPEPLVVLDEAFGVVAASRSFYNFFNLDPEQSRGQLLFSLGNGQWDIPALRVLLQDIIPLHAVMEGFEVDHDFPQLGRKIMLLNARTVGYAGNEKPNILLAFKDITAPRAIEIEKQKLLEHTEELLRNEHVLLEEMRHRIANSLQIIGSILQLKARAVSSEESRHHLRDAHERVMSVAAIQNHLAMSKGIEQIEVGSYLRKLCSGLESSMVEENRPILIKVVADQATVTSASAVSLGFMVTELVINAIKYAFEPWTAAQAHIAVLYEVDGQGWRLSVQDNGAGASENTNSVGGGLGSLIVDSLAKKLNATVRTISSSTGMCVTVTHASYPLHLPLAA
jgi:chemotaxis protein methyltransferase CheR